MPFISQIMSAKICDTARQKIVASSLQYMTNDVSHVNPRFSKLAKADSYMTHQIPT